MDKIDMIAGQYGLTSTLYTISQFVATICEGRDESHGWKHGYEVTELALNLSMKWKSDISREFLEGIIIVGFSHDVNDSKYDIDGTLGEQLKQFMCSTFGSTKGQWYCAIIDRISYSKEIKMRQTTGTVDWLPLLGKLGAAIREYVSIADKLESLGKTGHERSKDYNRKVFLKKHGREPTEKELFDLVSFIVDTKLLTLKNFIYIDNGKELSEILTKELVDLHEQWRLTL